MTGGDFVKEILMHVPEVRGSLDTVYRWLNQAIWDIESLEDWPFMASLFQHTFSGDGVSPFDMSSERPRDLMRVEIGDITLTIVDKFEDFVLTEVSGDTPAVCSLNKQKLYWKPEVSAADDTQLKVWHLQRSETVTETTEDNWLLNNSYELVKFKVLISACAYTKQQEMVDKYATLFEAELNNLRERFGIPIPQK
jgi:hypothetical protein